MELIITAEDPVDIVAVQGDRIDAAAAIAFKDNFREVTQSRNGAVVLDLSKVVFVDSSGLGALVAAQKILGHGRKLELAGLQPPVAKVMELTRMDTVFRVHQDADAARALHGSSAA